MNLFCQDQNIFGPPQGADCTIASFPSNKASETYQILFLGYLHKSFNFLVQVETLTICTCAFRISFSSKKKWRMFWMDPLSMDVGNIKIFTTSVKIIFKTISCRHLEDKKPRLVDFSQILSLAARSLQFNRKILASKYI